MITGESFQSYSKDNGEWRVFVQPNPAGWSVRVYIIQRQGTDSFLAEMHSGHFVMVKIKEGERNPTPTMEVRQDVWQLIVDALANTTTPTKQGAVDTELKATKYHLEDMRSLVLKKKL